jgi:hypothetical protein
LVVELQTLDPSLHFEASAPPPLCAFALNPEHQKPKIRAGVRTDTALQTNVSFSTAGLYGFEFLAGGTAALGTNPLVALVIDGINRTNLFLTSTNATRYFLSLTVSAGVHTVGLAFLNDYYAPPADRNAWFDYLTITPPASLTLAALIPDLPHQRLTLQWEAAPGTAYEIQMTPLLAPPAWRPLTTVTNLGTLLSWEDTGELSGAPPFSPAAPSRYYRLRQSGS